MFTFCPYCQEKLRFNTKLKYEKLQQTTPAAAGPTLIGLICPNCRNMCLGFQALEEHMLSCNGGASNSVMLPQPGPLRPSPAAMAAGMEELEICYICDKSFKSHRSLDNDIKKQHGLAVD